MKFAVFEALYRRGTWLIRNKGDFPEKWSRTKVRKFCCITSYPYDSASNIVGTSVWFFPLGNDTLSFFSHLSLTHEEKISNFCIRKAFEDIEIFEFVHRPSIIIPLSYQIEVKKAKVHGLFYAFWSIDSLDFFDTEIVRSDISFDRTRIISYEWPVIDRRNNIEWVIFPKGCDDRSLVVRTRTDIHIFFYIRIGDITPVGVISLFDLDEVRSIRIAQKSSCSISTRLPCCIWSNRIFMNIRHFEVRPTYLRPSTHFSAHNHRIISHEDSFGSWVLCSSASDTSASDSISESYTLISEEFRTIIHDIRRCEIEERTMRKVDMWTRLCIWSIVCFYTVRSIFISVKTFEAPIRIRNHSETITVRHIFCHGKCLASCSLWSGTCRCHTDTTREIFRDDLDSDFSRRSTDKLCPITVRDEMSTYEFITISRINIYSHTSDEYCRNQSNKWTHKKV